MASYARQMADRPQVADHYGAQYRDFADDVYAEFRRAAFGQDVGQNSWLTVDELERFGVQLQLGSSSRLLDVGCGSGGPALHLARATGCQVVGVELYEEAVASGNRGAHKAGLEEEVTFVQADASGALPFEEGEFDALFASTRSIISQTATGSLPTGRACYAPAGDCCSPIQ